MQKVFLIIDCLYAYNASSFLSDLVIEYLQKAVTNNIAKYILMLLPGKLQLPLFHGTSFYFQVPPWTVSYSKQYANYS